MVYLLKLLRRLREQRVIKSFTDCWMRGTCGKTRSLAFIVRVFRILARQVKKLDRYSIASNDSAHNAAGKWRVFYSFPREHRVKGEKPPYDISRNIIFHRSVPWVFRETMRRCGGFFACSLPSRWCWRERSERLRCLCRDIIARATTNGERGRRNYVNNCVAELFVSRLCYVIRDKSLFCSFVTVRQGPLLSKRTLHSAMQR